MQINYPIDRLCLQDFQVICSYDWCVMLTRKTIAILHVLYHCMVIYLFASLNIMCLLQAFASLNPVLSMITTRASKPEPKTFHKCPPYLPICGISPPLQVNFSCATFKPSKLLILQICSSVLSSWGSHRWFIIFPVMIKLCLADLHA